MTAKRFKCEFDGCHGYLFDDEYKTFYQLKDSEPNIELLCERLNELHEENKELRLLVDTLKEQNMKFKLRLKDLGVEYL